MGREPAEIPDDTKSNKTPNIWFVEYLTSHDAYHHGVSEVLYSAQSDFQSITVADTGAYGRALFLDGKIQTTEGDEAFYHEPLVHTACATHANPKSVLILGGADGGAAREALRWNSVQSVTIVDIDAQVVSACRQHLPCLSKGAFDDARCTVIIGDAMKFVAQTQQLFDVIICDLTDPMERSPSLSLFTQEFFRDLRGVLTPRGAISIQAGPASLVENRILFPRICSTLSSVFSNVAPFQIFVPTYGSPLAMVLATCDEDPMPSEEELNDTFEHQVSGQMHMLDGRAFHGLFAVPRCVRKAIADETEIFTVKNTANAFGCGTLM